MGEGTDALWADCSLVLLRSPRGASHLQWDVLYVGLRDPSARQSERNGTFTLVSVGPACCLSDLSPSFLTGLPRHWAPGPVSKGAWTLAGAAKALDNCPARLQWSGAEATPGVPPRGSFLRKRSCCCLKPLRFCSNRGVSADLHHAWGRGRPGRRVAVSRADPVGGVHRHWEASFRGLHNRCFIHLEGSCEASPCSSLI